MARQLQTAQAQEQRVPNSVDAWILGSSVASLASAVHLICDANVPASQIHILESRSTPGDGIISIGDPLNGYDHRPGCMPTFNDACMERLLALLPSTIGSGRTVLEDMKELCANDHDEDVPGTHILIEGDDGPVKLDTRKSLNLKDRMDLMVLILKPEKILVRKRINEFFRESFFGSRFWITLSTIFGFQPWHSATEFRRCLRRYSSEVRNLNTNRPLDCTKYNQFESIVTPMIGFLKHQGVDFQLNTKIRDIVTRLDSGTVSISAIRALQDGAEETITVCPKDIVIISLGSTTSGSSSGTNNDPPLMVTMEAENKLDENWSIWLDLATQYPSFGDPYNFCTRISESRLESFTVTLKDPEFFTRFINLTHDRPGLGTFVSLKDSNWMISICIPRQPFFSSQPENINVFWGYGLRPDREGNFVRKPMLFCSGEEIMTELLSLLGFPSASIRRNSITIPCVMPRRTASMLPRTCQNRPNVIPDGTANLAVIGQFVNIPDETTVSLDYSVRGAQLAVSQLMGIGKEP
ncbi:hypothetical protein N7530_012793, partial [Penicillium desertorum]